MSGTKRKYFSGTTLEQAVVAAACEYGLSPDEVAYRRIEKRHGFLRSRKRVLIAVEPDAPKRALSPAGNGAPAEPVAEPSRARPRTSNERGSNERGSNEGSRGGRGRGEAAARGRRIEGPRDRGPAPSLGLAPGSGRPRGGAARHPLDALAEDQAAHARRAMELERAEFERARQERSAGAPAGPEPWEEDAWKPEPQEGIGREGEHREGRSRGRRRRERKAPAREQGPRRRDEPVVHEVPEDGSPAERATAYLLAVTGLDLEASVKVQEDQVLVELAGPDGDLVLQDHGKALASLEHLLPKVIRGLSGEKLFCHVDCQGFKLQRQEELEELAREVANEVRESGEPRTLEPLNPAERRIVHMTLADDPDVETESEGGGYLKRLKIWPV